MTNIGAGKPDGHKRGDVPTYLPSWPDWSKLPTDAEKKPHRVRTGRIALLAGAVVVLALLWHADPLVVLPFLLGLLPILRRSS